MCPSQRGLCLPETFSAYGPAFPRCQLDGFENLRVSGAAAEVATQIMCYFFVVRILVEQFRNHHDEARHAIAALKGTGLDKSLLHRCPYRKPKTADRDRESADTPSRWV